MIALRGIVRRTEESSSSSSSWTWKGVWTFGSLPDDEVAALAERNPSCRPFEYAWEEAKQAGDVLVPSANIVERTKRKDDGGATTPHETPKSTGADYSSKAEEAESNAAAATDGGSITPTVKMAEGNPSTGPNDKSLKSMVSGQGAVKDVGSAEPMQVDEPIDANNEETTKDAKVESKSEQPTTVDTHDEPSVAGDKSKEPDSEKSSDKVDKANEKEIQQEKPKEGQVVAEEQEKVTFATTNPGDPPYTDAASKYPEKCPPGGAWKGHFETATNRKDKSTYQVAEKFCLFFNATPANDARVLFLLTDEDANEANKEKDDAKGESKQEEGNALLPAGLIHVRGSGSNHYGTWELIGSFNVETGVLECQRMYVRTEEKPKSPARRGRPRKSAGRRVSIEDAALAANTPRPSRKRQASWRKRASLSDDDDTPVVTVRRPSAGPGKGTGKRGRPRKHPIVEPQPPAAPGSMFSPTGTTVSVPSSGGSTKRSPVSTPRVPAKAAMSGQKRRASSQPKPSPPSGSSTVKLPHAGDPKDARWRSAHFLYYQRYEVSSDDGGSNRASPNTAADAASFVVYEGEMSQGNCLRDGRGVCLYNNGTLYEGEWKRNKEHGKGTLMTADRRRVIYRGDWERGKMHGTGTYFYTQDDPYASSRRRKDESLEQLGSRYEGEFRENTRHGTGKYFLPDGSAYNGDWRADQMSGNGEFKWPDGSVYVGSWKDGKRNGSGMLRASDGFTYDGGWVQNAMEGRGIATYPSGQRYEGMFAQGRREGRGTIHFANGAVYEGRFRDDCMEGGGTMKMTSNAMIPRRRTEEHEDSGDDEDGEDWMIPISFHSDIGYIHQKAGFTVEGE